MTKGSKRKWDWSKHLLADGQWIRVDPALSKAFAARPIVAGLLGQLPEEQLLLYSNRALGRHTEAPEIVQLMRAFVRSRQVVLAAGVACLMLFVAFVGASQAGVFSGWIVWALGVTALALSGLAVQLLKRRSSRLAGRFVSACLTKFVEDWRCPSCMEPLLGASIEESEIVCVHCKTRLRETDLSLPIWELKAIPASHELTNEDARFRAEIEERKKFTGVGNTVKTMLRIWLIAAGVVGGILLMLYLVIKVFAK